MDALSLISATSHRWISLGNAFVSRKSVSIITVYYLVFQDTNYLKVASWGRKIMQPIARIMDKENKVDDSGAESGQSSQRNSLKKSSSSLSIGNTSKRVAKPFYRQDKAD